MSDFLPPIPDWMRDRLESDLKYNSARAYRAARAAKTDADATPATTPPSPEARSNATVGFKIGSTVVWKCPDGTTRQGIVVRLAARGGRRTEVSFDDGGIIMVPNGYLTQLVAISL
jgi:hypothetical protein